PGSKQKGGDLGNFSRGRMIKEFEEAAFSQKIDEIGPIIQTAYGYHIIQVQERKEASLRSLKDEEDSIREHLDNSKKQKIVIEFIEGLKAKANIKYEGNS
ncbi:peptidylprolyl isomerase, partial [Verrucomicrobiota bacterium]